MKEQAGNQQWVSYAAVVVNDYRCDRLTNDHKGEKVSVQQVPQDWVVPRFHANYSCDQVNQGDGLQAGKNPQSITTPTNLFVSQQLLLDTKELSKKLYISEITHIPSNQSAFIYG